MFSGNGYQIHNGNFYNVSGDINLETHHNFTIQNHEPSAPVSPLLLDSNMGVEDDRDAGPQQHLTNQQFEAAFRERPDRRLGRGQAEGPQRNGGGPGAVRNLPHGIIARSAPYNTASRPRRSAIPVDDMPASAEGPPLPIHDGSSFAANNVNVTHNHHGEAGIHILHRAVALEALYDSADSFPQPKCHPETRTTMLDTLYSWAVEPSSAAGPIRWLHGPAGAGKSAIMQTLCQNLQTAGRLGGAFFFKRDHATRGNAKTLFATLAYQLALKNADLNLAISRSVERDPSVVGRSMDVQLHQLIIEPCLSLTNCPSLTLLIDGLDEREAHIREIFEDPSFNRIFDCINVEQSFEDIRTYFRDEFTRIHRSHRTMGNVPAPWPAWSVLASLVDKSSGHFIYASTIIKFIDDKYSRPTERLAAVQNSSATDYDSPFAALDQLYIQILSAVPARFHSKLPGAWDVELILRGLHSVLDIPSQGGTISAHHASFLDFLHDPRRSLNFHIDVESRLNLVRAVLNVLSHDNHRSGTPDDPLAWHLTANDLIECLVSLLPPVERVPRIKTRLFEDEIKQVLLWLKTVPQDLTQRLEGYHLMFSWDTWLLSSDYAFMEHASLAGIFSLSPKALSALQTGMSGWLSMSPADCRRLVARTPKLADVFLAQLVLPRDRDR
ncbi:hypothetical protein B0H19DRAFT_1274636 [Mycena capillaripes]|nr:hypothetical protein B0H19DRAFT_1274636 [Mycena capillaripes]